MPNPFAYETQCPVCKQPVTASPLRLKGEWHDFAECHACRSIIDMCCYVPPRRNTAVILPLTMRVAQRVTR